MTTAINQAKHVHFTGIKGVGMTAAALCVQDLGISVSGSDVDTDFVTKDTLQERSIKTFAGFSPDDIPGEADHLVYTGAHGGVTNPQVVAAQSRGLRVLSHAQAVGELMQRKIGISVCGVGGKTSISAMLATILDYAGLKPSFLIGVGKVLNLQVPGRIDSGEHFIAEADEYVVSPGTDQTPRFMYQTPQAIICTNIAYDHPDAYSSLDETKAAFQQFFHLLPENGFLVLNGDSGPIREIDSGQSKKFFYGLTPDNNQWWLKDTYIGEGKQMVIFANSGEEIRLTLSVPGEFNALNALAAFICARELGLDISTIIEALQLFRGSMRRFEKKAAVGDILFYDDYAHHPTEIVATLKAAKLWLPLSRLVAVFQPHTYSRTSALLDQFAQSFKHADHVIITDIYGSEREAADPTISGYILAEKVKTYHPSVEYVPLDSIYTHLVSLLKSQDALFTLGAGNIYQIHDLLISTFESSRAS
jgi:UDP-N-acetylmuramate--alanine ligase